MTLKEIIAAWLKEHGYDGLFHADNCCGCHVDDLMPCDEPSPNCEPGYAREGVCECGGGCLWGIWRERPLLNVNYQDFVRRGIERLLGEMI